MTQSLRQIIASNCSLNKAPRDWDFCIRHLRTSGNLEPQTNTDDTKSATVSYEGLFSNKVSTSRVFTYWHSTDEWCSDTTTSVALSIYDQASTSSHARLVSCSHFPFIVQSSPAAGVATHQQHRLSSFSHYFSFTCGCRYDDTALFPQAYPPFQTACAAGVYSLYSGS